MHLKKSKPSEAELAKQALEQKVDAMMSVEAPKPPAQAKTAEPAVQSVSAPLTADQTTAPQLPPQLLKTIGKKPAKSTLKIIKDTPPDDGPPSKPKPAKAEPASQPQPASAPTEPVPAEPEPANGNAPLTTDPLDDKDTDQAVASIMAEEADMQLAVADAVDRQKATLSQPRGPGALHRFFTSFWTWLFIFGTAGVVYAWFH